MDMKKSILLIALFCVFSACKREYDPEKFGPEVIIVPADFTVSGFTVSPSNTINLATQDVYLNCTMDQRAEFKVVIKGLLSGAEKILRGAAESINATNSNWTGDSDNLYIFRAGENCSVELSFRGATKKYYDTISIIGENVYPNVTILNSFEGISIGKNVTGTVTYGVYIDTADIPQTDIRTDGLLTTCQGVQSVLFDGVDIDRDYYIGGLYLQPPSPSVPFVFDGYSPDSLYINAYVYSYGDKSAKLSIGFSEDDNDDLVSDNINDDSWVKEVPIDGPIGWTLISFRLKDFQDSKPMVGNGSFNLDKIKAFNMNFNATVAGNRARFNLDYVVISYGKAFEP